MTESKRHFSLAPCAATVSARCRNKRLRGFLSRLSPAFWEIACDCGSAHVEPERTIAAIRTADTSAPPAAAAPAALRRFLECCFRSDRSKPQSLTACKPRGPPVGIAFVGTLAFTHFLLLLQLVGREPRGNVITPDRHPKHNLLSRFNGGLAAHTLRHGGFTFGFEGFSLSLKDFRFQ